MELLSTTFTAFAMSNSSNEWPFVSMPNFLQQAGEINGMLDSEAIFFSPLIAQSEIESWENYSVANHNWMNDGVERKGLSNDDPGQISDLIYPVDERSVYFPNYSLPIWQIAPSPINASVINFDLLTLPSLAYAVIDAVESRKANLSGMGVFSFLVQNFAGQAPDHAGQAPQSCILQPVFETMEIDAAIGGFMGAFLRCTYGRVFKGPRNLASHMFHKLADKSRGYFLL